jgi:hypothetical protein
VLWEAPAELEVGDTAALETCTTAAVPKYSLLPESAILPIDWFCGEAHPIHRSRQ